MVIKMNSVNMYEGIVKNAIYKEFAKKNGASLFNFAANNCSIEEFISISYVLCPDFIEVNGYVFISDLFATEGEEGINEVRRLEQEFNYDKKKIEQWVNSWSLGDFFIGKHCESMDNDRILEQFGKVLIYNWSRRLNELFPEKKMVVEIGNEIMGELGLTVTVYEIS